MRKPIAITSRMLETAISAALTAFARSSIAMRKLMLVSGAESELDGWTRASNERSAGRERIGGKACRFSQQVRDVTLALLKYACLVKSIFAVACKVQVMRGAYLELRKYAW